MYMTGKERMKIALTGGIPDRIPCAPDISNMIPAKLTGKPFQEIYIRNNPPLWRAYIDAVDRLGIDGWFTYAYLNFKTKSQVSVEFKTHFEGDREIVTQIIHTPKGDLTSSNTFYTADPPTPTEKLVKDFEKDFEKLLYMFPEITGYETTDYDMMNKAFGDRGLIMVTLTAPGFHIYNEYFEGNLEALTYAYYDYPDLFEEFHERYTKWTYRQLDMILDAKPESVLTGGSGSITMASPELFDRYSLPVIKTITAECKKAGIITGIHSCGKEMHLIERCANQTDLDYVNPLEISPQGDSDLKTAKQLYGKKLSLMGNLHTTNVMLRGDVRLVEKRSLEAILAAGEGGGFVLSTGDQCGRDTPLENIQTMVKVCKEYGDYSNFDTEKIENRLKELNRE